MRVRRAFGFIDLCGFTRLTDAQGDETAVRALEAFRHAVRVVCSRRGVRVAKWLGDGAMLVSVELEPLVSAVLELESRIGRGEPPLALRAGVNVGDVILFEGDDYIGHPVNLAARLSEMAGPNGILATAEAAAGTPPWAVAAPMGELAVRGLSRPVAVSALRARVPGDDGVVDPVCGMALPRDGALVRHPEEVPGAVRFCSASCAETWEGRPGPAPDEPLLV